MPTYRAIEVTKAYSNGSKDIITEVTCKRCLGNGVLPQYRNVNGGKCYECEGTGVTEKTIKVTSSDEIVMVNRTTEVKSIAPVNDNEAMKNAMIRINNERKEQREALKRMKEEDQKLQEEINNDTFRFTWDD